MSEHLSRAARERLAEEIGPLPVTMRLLAIENGRALLQLEYAGVATDRCGPPRWLAVGDDLTLAWTRPEISDA